MTLVLNRLYHGYFWIFDELSDPRSSHILLSSPLSVLAVTFAYLHIVRVIGPKLMENRPPYDIKNVILLYNAVQILVNTYISIKAARHVLKNPFGCLDLDWSDDPEAMDQLFIMNIFFHTKLLDLVDTVFFVLRKSYRQVSFLHLYHHSGMTILMWFGIRFFPGGMSLWIPMINGFVHVVMFIYYSLTALDSSWKQSIAFKKRLTQIQLLQFIIILTVCIAIVFSDCSYPKLAGLMLIPQNLFITILFGDFYLKTYVFNKKSSKSTA
ncbi:unnamed protein product [Phaedon cochleariae]|uniref:Elongation of very long chain fatty acids protein n=1 Tax=Phaedon cochleariae TaxID=80249 RepID=A0A9N9X1Z4_PHACE|nr:unnamed protein product [Phaedon cochleariae]